MWPESQKQKQEKNNMYLEQEKSVSCSWDVLTAKSRRAMGWRQTCAMIWGKNNKERMMLLSMDK